MRQQAESTGNITNAISDIVDQTSLPVLNAAIEAARRGDRTGLCRGGRRSTQAGGKNHECDSGSGRRHQRCATFGQGQRGRGGTLGHGRKQNHDLANASGEAFMETVSSPLRQFRGDSLRRRYG